MSVFSWILLSGLLMSAIALVGAVTLVLNDSTLQRILLPLVALSAGSLIGGAFFHMIPAGFEAIDDLALVGLLVVLGFSAFLLLEQLLHWHHCHRAQADCRKPLTYLILIGDALHNFLGGLAIAGTFLIDIRLGIVSWLAAAAHEVPQELGDFGVLIHGGWSKKRALLLNVFSALTFLAGSLIAYAASFAIDVTWLVPFAAGNFLYIGASDLVPEIKTHPSVKANLIHFAAFLTGVGILFVAQLSFAH
jgi:zinc and cadmium transporter